VSATDSADAVPPALDQGLSGYPLRAFVICFISLSFANMDQALFGYAVPAIRQEFGVGLEVIGWVFGLSFGLAGVMIAGIGVLTDRIGRKLVLTSSIVVSSIFVTLHSVAPNIIALGIFRTFGFAAGGSQVPVTGTIVVEESPARYRGVLSGILQAGYPLGWFLASLLAAPILGRFGWRPMFLIGLISVPFALVVWRFIRETERFRVHRAALGAARDKRSRKNLEPAKIRHLFAPDLIKTTVVLFLGEFLHVAAYGGSAFYLPTYFVEVRGFTITQSTLLVGSAYGIGALGYVLSSFVGEYLMTRRNVIVAWSWAGTVAFLCLIWATSSVLSIVIVFGLVTMFFYGTTAVKFTFLAEHFPTRVRATGVGFSGALAVNLGLALGPLVVSYAIGRLGWNMAFTTFVAIPLFFSGLVFLMLKPVASGVEVEEIAT
jgi:MFS family permease